MLRLLGTIHAANGTSKNNMTTASPFAIPPTARWLKLTTAQAGVRFAIKPDTKGYDPFNPAAYFTPSNWVQTSTLAATASDLPLAQNVTQAEHVDRLGGAPAVVAIYAGSADSDVLVYVDDGP